MLVVQQKRVVFHFLHSKVQFLLGCASDYPVVTLIIIEFQNPVRDASFKAPFSRRFSRTLNSLPSVDGARTPGEFVHYLSSVANAANEIIEN